ncbi:MAG: HD domain-containing protein [Flavobacteriaceae bacterium]|nr:HD domain-containing protein [Flavobacteriaceae bacterium]
MVRDDLKFFRDFYDNIHGFIGVTKLESEIIDKPIFQRLRNIRQLGLLDYVFPGALHNRFNHSIGVLHIADKMVVSLQDKGFLEGRRKIIRMAALLHDIGHYPLSHLVESVVLEDAKSKIPTTDIVIELEGENQLEFDFVSNKIHELNVELHDSRNKKKDFAHHEIISNIVIRKTEIYEILRKEFSETQINEIMQIISGSFQGPEGLIIHSELDADRFDYLIRDSHQTGVIYGLFDFDQIIRNLELFEPEDNRLVVNEKARKALEHYLMCRYFLYTTVIYHKTMVSFDIIVKNAYKGLLERKMVWSYSDLIKNFEKPELVKKFIQYNDLSFFDILQKVYDGDRPWDETKKYEISDDLLFSSIESILYRKPLKLCKSSEKLVEIKQKTEDYIYFEPAVKERIVELAEIEKEWYIKFKKNVSITEIRPYVVLGDEGPSKNEEYETIKIVKYVSPDQPEINHLIKEESSIINVLSNYNLSIKRIYTKDDEHVEKLNSAIIEYDKERKES